MRCRDLKLELKAQRARYLRLYFEPCFHFIFISFCLKKMYELTIFLGYLNRKAKEMYITTNFLTFFPKVVL